MTQRRSAPGEPPTPAPWRGSAICRAHALIVAADPGAALAHARALARGLGGWVASRRRQRLTLRVPAERLEILVDALGVGGTLRNERIERRDVTARLVALRCWRDDALSARARLQALASRHGRGAAPAPRILQQIARIDVRLARIAGRLSHLERNVAYATLSLRALVR